MLADARLLFSALEVVILENPRWRGMHDTEKIDSNERNGQVAEEFSRSSGTNGHGKAQRRRKAAAYPSFSIENPAGVEKDDNFFLL